MGSGLVPCILLGRRVNETLIFYRLSSAGCLPLRQLFSDHVASEKEGSRDDKNSNAKKAPPHNVVRDSVLVLAHCSSEAFAALAGSINANTIVLTFSRAFFGDCFVQ